MNNITLSGALQTLGFCIATLLATGVLVLAGLSERNSASGNLISVSHTTKDSR
jgi:Flp pilus assembly protein protease CpaA